MWKKAPQTELTRISINIIDKYSYKREKIIEDDRCTITQAIK